MNIVVTGAAGFVGTVLIPRLLARDHRVIGLDRLPTGGSEPASADERFTMVVDDLNEPGVLERVLPGADAVIHLAALVGYPACAADPEGAVRANVEATERLVQGIAPGCRLVFSSTESVYGPVPDGWCHEDVRCLPTSLYGQTKLQAEQLVLNRDDSVVLRFPSSFGLSPSPRWDLIVNDFVRTALDEGRLDLYEPLVRRSFIHVVDVARSLELLLDVDDPKHRIYNVGDPRMNMTKAELASRIAGVLDLELEIIHTASRRDAERRDFAMSYERIAALGFEVSIPFEEGIRGLADALGAGR